MPIFVVSILFVVVDGTIEVVSVVTVVIADSDVVAALLSALDVVPDVDSIAALVVALDVLLEVFVV